jgi:hypothetical protein
MEVAHLPHEDDVGVLARHRPQRAGEADGGGAEAALDRDAPPVLDVEDLPLRLAHRREHQPLRGGGRERFAVQRNQPGLHAQHGQEPRLDMEAGGGAPDGQAEELLDLPHGPGR